MVAIRMGKLTTMPAGLIYASVSVHAAKEEESKKQLLSIYAALPLHSKYVEEQPGHLQMGFASIRTATGHCIGWCNGVYVFVKNGIMDTVQFGKDAYVYMKNPPRDFLPKMGVITVSKGLGFSKKKSNCLLPSSVSNREKVYATSQQIFRVVKSLSIKNSMKESLPKLKEKTKLRSSAEIEVPAKIPHVSKHSVPLPTELSSEAKTKSESTSGATQIMPDLKLMEHGQSYPEDIDTYSTRS
uniref:MICOS complex subunit n=1 Tax=Saimiri boliviensis boliviensis TaxID=39432 RepID=A0A2K6U4V1_SAIBB